MKVVCSVAVVALLLAGCGGESPTAPSGPQYPSVAGNYAGTTTMSFPELFQTLSCPTTTSVTQTGASVNVAPLVLGGQCAGTSIPFGAATIDSNGAFQGQGSTTFTDPDCGTYNVTGSGGFFGRELRISIVATSATCYNFNMTMTLLR